MTTHTNLTQALTSLIDTIELLPGDDSLVELEDCDSPDVFAGTTLEIPGHELRAMCEQAFGPAVFSQVESCDDPDAFLCTTLKVPNMTTREIWATDPLAVRHA